MKENKSEVLLHHSSYRFTPRYRMHPSIRSFPSSQFYESMLEDRVSIAHRPQLNCIWPRQKEHRRFIDCRTSQSMGLSPELNRSCDAALMESKVGVARVVLPGGNRILIIVYCQIQLYFHHARYYQACFLRFEES